MFSQWPNVNFTMITDVFKMILSDFHSDTVWPAHRVWVTFIMKLYALPMTLYTIIMTSVSSQCHSVTFTLTFCYLWNLCALHSDCVTRTNTLTVICNLHKVLYALIMILYDFCYDYVTSTCCVILTETLCALTRTLYSFKMIVCPLKWLFDLQMTCMLL